MKTGHLSATFADCAGMTALSDHPLGLGDK